jgi:hypothetical protein
VVNYLFFLRPARIVGSLTLRLLVSQAIRLISGQWSVALVSLDMPHYLIVQAQDNFLFSDE